MGIKDLLPFVRKNVLDAIKTIPLSDFSGRVIAIDALYWLFANIHICRREILKTTNLEHFDPDDKDTILHTCKFLISFIEKLLKHGIKPIFIFDGPNIPKEKAIEHEKRKKPKVEYKKQIEELTLKIRSPHRDILLPID